MTPCPYQPAVYAALDQLAAAYARIATLERQKAELSAELTRYTAAACKP